MALSIRILKTLIIYIFVFSYSINKDDESIIVNMEVKICFPIGRTTYCVPSNKGLVIIDHQRLPVCHMQGWPNLSSKSYMSLQQCQTQNNTKYVVEHNKVSASILCSFILTHHLIFLHVKNRITEYFWVFFYYNIIIF